METIDRAWAEMLVYERDGNFVLTAPAHIVDTSDADEAAKAAKEFAIPAKVSPFLKWVVGDFVESDKPNSNTQFWTKADLAKAEHTIRYVPLNMVHRSKQPVGFMSNTRVVEADGDEAADRIKIQALGAMWTHVFPFESVLVDNAAEAGNLFYSMECRGTHLHCAGDNGCGETFEYLKADTHCEHLLERSSIRHIVNPVFRGGALIVPPVKPGWKNAKADVFSDAVLQEAAKLIDLTEEQYSKTAAQGDMSADQWAWLMASIVSLSNA